MSIKGKKITLRGTLLEEMLGTGNTNPDIHDTYIASKAPDAPSREEEIAAIGVEAAIDQGRTVFARDEEGNLIIWDYQMKGFFKSACKALRDDKITISSTMKSYKQKIDLNIFPGPRKIILEIPEGKLIDECQRPLRASTPLGERVALASSETVPAGSTFDFWVFCVGRNNSYVDAVTEWLDFGRLNGLGQWRNSGKGRFSYEIISIEDAEI